MTQSLYQLKALINKYTLAALFLIFFANKSISAEHPTTTCILASSKSIVTMSNLVESVRTARLGDFRIFCNDPNGYEITLSSLNDGKLVHNQKANSVIYYYVGFRIRSNNFTHDFGDGTYTYTSNTASAVSGDVMRITMHLNVIGTPVAGEYADSFSVSVSSND